MEHISENSRRLAAVIERRLTDANISLRDASRRTGIPLTTLTRRLTGNSPFSASELFVFASMFETTASSLVSEAEAA